MLLAIIGLTGLALAVGFVVGFTTFRRALCWCPACGTTLRCPECVNRRVAYDGAIGAGATLR